MKPKNKKKKQKGMAHDDLKQDKKLIKKMVKKDCVK